MRVLFDGIVWLQVDGQSTGPSVDSARQNLASTFVNAFVNAGFGQDKLLTAAAASDDPNRCSQIHANDGALLPKVPLLCHPQPLLPHGPRLLMPCSPFVSNVSWIYKNKDHGKMSAAASLGMITLWDVEGGLTQIDKWVTWLCCQSVWML